jgi:hypothetical protein
MLLFIKKRFEDAIRNGEKTIELRCGSRYRNLRPGDFLSLNGHFRKRIERVETFASRDELLAGLHGRYERAGFASRQDCRKTIDACYPSSSGCFYVLHLR